MYFDNVGGEILDTVLTRLARHARIVICGAISQYNNDGPRRGPANYMALLVNRARMEGFVVFDYAKRYAEAAQRDGRLDRRRPAEIASSTSSTGSSDFPETLLKLYSGENFGKLILSVGGERARRRRAPRPGPGRPGRGAQYHSARRSRPAFLRRRPSPGRPTPARCA